jgi:hypothetical protein
MLGHRVALSGRQCREVCVRVCALILGRGVRVLSMAHAVECSGVPWCDSAGDSRNPRHRSTGGFSIGGG